MPISTSRPRSGDGTPGSCRLRRRRRASTTPGTRLTVGAAAAGRLAAQLAEHDRLVGVAAEQGRAAKYKAAIATLDEAAATIKESRAFRDRLSATVDVTVLDQWLDRNEAYDKALAALYAGARLGRRQGHRQGAQGDRRGEGSAGAAAAGRARARGHHGGHRPRAASTRRSIEIEGAKAALADVLDAGGRAARASPSERAIDGTLMRRLAAGTLRAAH